MPASDKKAVVTVVVTALLLVIVGFAISRTSRSYSEQLPLRQQSKYFDFRFKQHPERIQSIARFADAFIDIANRDFFKAEFDYPIRVLVTEDSARHRALVSQQFGVADPTMGIFLYQHNLFATESPVWALFSQNHAPAGRAKFKRSAGLGNRRHSHFLRKILRLLARRRAGCQLGISESLENKRARREFGAARFARNSRHDRGSRRRESEQRLVSIFLWEQGKFKQFLDFIKRREKNGFDSYFEAAMGMPIERVIPLWQDYLARIAARRSEIVRLPLSATLPNEEAFHKFAASYGISVSSE